MALSKEEVAKLYVATFNRAPDSEGLDYWLNDSAVSNLDELAVAMLDSEEASTIYPEGTTNEDFVSSMYQNMFNRYADSEGLTYWTEQLSLGNLSRSVMIKALIDGAEADSGDADDKATIANKTTVGLNFAQSGKNDVEAAKSVISVVTENPSTVALANANIIQAEPVVTELLDLVVLTKTDTASNFVNQITNLENIHNAVVSGTASVSDLTAIDNLTAGMVTAATVTDTAANLTGWTGASTYSTTTTNVTDLDATNTADLSTITSTTVNAAVANDVTFAGNLGNAVVTIADGATMTTTAAIAAGNTFNKAATGALTITSATADITLGGSSNTTVTGLTAALDATAVTGTLNVTVATDADVSVATGSGTNSIDADALTDGQVLTVTGDDDASVSLVGGDLSAGTGTGAYTVTATTGTNVITTGDGNDRITGGAGADDITAGDGNDAIIYATTADLFTGSALVDTTIAGGNGNDAIALGGGVTVASTDDWATNAPTSIEYITASGATDTAISFTSHADFTTDTNITTIDFSADTNATGNNVIDVSNLTTSMTLTGSAGNDTITGTNAQDTINLGSGGRDTVVFKGTGTTKDIINNFDMGAGNDQMQISIAAAETGGYDIVNLSTGGSSGAGALVITGVAGATAATNGNAVYTITTAHYGSLDTVLRTLETGQTNRLTGVGALDANDMFYIVWSDGTQDHLTEVVTDGTVAGGLFGTNSLTGTVIASTADNGFQVGINTDNFALIT